MPVKPFVAAALVSLLWASAASAQLRCGWLENPKAGEWHLTDRQSKWAIAGSDYEAEGFDLIQDIYSGEYEPMNRYYGYTCACLETLVDDLSYQIVTISSYRAMPMASCESDENLPTVQK